MMVNIDKGTNLESLGKFFRDYRVGRGLTLEEASGDWSAATLSRFERGELDISTDKAVGLLMRLGIDELDFLDYYEADGRNFPMELQELIQLNDVPKLRQRERDYFAVHPSRNNATELVRILFESARRWPQADFRLSAEDEQRLADFLSVPSQFSLVELEFFKAIVGPASHELLELLVQRAQTQPQDWRSQAQMQLLMVWLGALMDQDIPLVEKLRPILAADFVDGPYTYVTTEFLPNWTFGEAVYRWLKDPSPDNSRRIARIIQGLRALGVETDAHWFELMFSRAQVGTVHHNNNLGNHPRTIRTAKTVGEAFMSRREYLGLSVTDVAHTSSVSSIRRFETGQTNMSLGSLVRLSGELGLLVSQVLTQPDGLHGQRQTLRSASGLISRLPAKQANQLIDQFTQQVVQMPEEIVAVERLVLKEAAGIIDFHSATNKKVAEEIERKMLQMKRWGSLETHAINPLAEILGPEELALIFGKGQRVLERHPLTVGTNEYFRGLCNAIISVVDTYTPATAAAFLNTLDWLPRIADATPMRWRAVGMWYVARYVVNATADNLQRLELFLHQTQRVGHVDTIQILRTEWTHRLSPKLFDQLLLSYVE